MSIELGSTPTAAKATASAGVHGQKAGKAGAAGGEDATGFSALMNLLAATDDGGCESISYGALTELDGASGDTTAAEAGAMLLAQSSVAAPLLTSIPAEPLMLSPAALQSVMSEVPDPATITSDVGLKATEVIKTSLQGAVKAADRGTSQKPAIGTLADTTTGASVGLRQVDSDTTASVSVNALLAHRSTVQSQTHSAVQQDLKEVRSTVVSQPAVSGAEAAVTLLAGGLSDLVRPQGRFGARSGTGQSGSSGFDGVFGQAMAATNRSDAVFEVPPASAVVPDTAVAETVSYWASHGVQTAELKLEGFGDAPVEVSIFLNGDQAQIEFRTDQVGVRQVLESAAAQLKDMLSSQGLQLAGVSVGSSGTGGDAGGERRQRSAAQQITMVKTEAVGAPVVRASHPAMGRSLDLFV